MFDLPERYADYLLEKRLIAEAYTLKRLEGISNLKLQVLIAEIEKTPYGLSMVYLRKKMGFEQLEQQVMFQFLMEWVSMGQAHASQEITKVMKMKENFNEGIKAATDYYQSHSLNLAGNFSKDQLTYTQEILKRGIAEGKTPKEMMNLIGEKFPNFSKHRLENIVRTESGRMYNHGRLTTFYANRDAVEGVRFSAIMDKRTSQICSSRHGLVLSLDEQDEIAANSPPLHFQCRSVWIPVSLFSSKKPNYESYREKINLDTTRPLEGFGFKDLFGIVPKKDYMVFYNVADSIKDKSQWQTQKPPDFDVPSTYNYKTPSGAEVKITVPQFREDFTGDMGSKSVVVKYIRDPRVTEAYVNGQKVKILDGVTDYMYPSGRTLPLPGEKRMYYIRVEVNGKKAALPVPEDVYEDYMRIIKEHKKKIEAESKKYYDMQRRIDEAMSY